MWSKKPTPVWAEARPLPSKFTMTIGKGDTLRHVQPGGGGYGDPFERAPARVLEDVLDEKVSPEAARWQVPRVVVARGVAPADVEAVMASRMEGRWLGFLGEPRVNVLRLNLELDRRFGPPR